MSAVRYLLDENVHPLYRAELLRREPSLVIWQIGMLGAPPRGKPDPDILRWCEENSFLLLTNNRKSMPGHLRDHLALGRHVPGILVLAEKMSVGETIEELFLIAVASTEDEYLDQIVHLPLT